MGAPPCSPNAIASKKGLDNHGMMGYNLPVSWENNYSHL